MRVIIVGAGGHGQVIADAALRAAERNGTITVVGYVDDRGDLHGRRILGVPIIGPLVSLAETAHDAIVVAIGENLTRRRICERLTKSGEQFAAIIHPTAIIAPDVTVAPGAMVCAGAIVNTGTKIGPHAILNTGCTVDHHNSVGPWAHIAPGVHTGGEANIGEGALIGIGATVMPGRKVGPWAVVGAGSLVYSDVPQGTTVAGVPAHSLVELR